MREEGDRETRVGWMLSLVREGRGTKRAECTCVPGRRRQREKVSMILRVYERHQRGETEQKEGREREGSSRGAGGEWERAKSEHERERETGMKKSLD